MSKGWDKPLFRTMDEALYWAWYQAPVKASTVKPSSVVTMMGDDSRDQLYEKEKNARRSSDSFMFERKPNGYDAGAQAGLIKGYVMRLAREECLHIMARHLRGIERAKARRAMVGIVLAYIDEGWSHRRLVLRLMAKYYGKPGVFLGDLADRYRVKGGRRAVSGIYREVSLVLHAVSVRAENRVCDYLQEQGVIQ